MSLFFLDRDFLPSVKAMVKEPRGNFTIAFCYFSIALLSALYYFIFHGPVNLHDMSHYLVSGVSMARDHADFIYPYSSMDPEGGGSAYGYFQENAQLIDVTKGYPSKLYSALFSIWFEVFGTLRFYSAHIVALVMITLSNMLLFAVARVFFTGVKQLLFVVTVAFTPVVVTAVYPGNDTFAYFASIFVLWCCFCTRLSPLSIGLLIGALSHFRSQIIFFIFILPVLLAWISERRSWRTTIFSSVAGILFSYLLIGFLLKLPIETAGASGGGLEFYIKFFMTSFYGPGDIAIVLDQFAHNAVNLSDKNYLYIFFFTGILGLFVKDAIFPRALAFSAVLVVIFPLIIYSLDRYSAPHARYYVGAIPLLVLSWFLLLENRVWVKSNMIAALTALIVFSAWYSINGFPINNVSSFSTIKSRIKFLDFAGADTALRDNFDEKSLLITNHSLPSGLSKLRNFIPYPKFEEFKLGDNREVDGLVFVYSDKGVNDFFRPVDWFVNGVLPDEIRDMSGTVFKKIYSQASNMYPEFTRPEAEAKFVIYKNVDASRVRTFDSSGKRTYLVNFHDELNTPLTKSPNFDADGAWSGAAHRLANSGGVEVGPGPESSNILFQTFPVKPGEKLKIQAVAMRVSNTPAKGRLQINWLDGEGKFLNASISLFSASIDASKYSKVFVAPLNAVQGVVYVTPHDEHSVLVFKSMEVLRASQDD